ncbi:helix-turn-helix transcriptional regulator [Cellulomonas sp. Leaf334]|uniref:helix-turn-helix transcriptional regulator n=1 Tax=Cellulomonas sp. Leaf334 TaxID=1736339 RepID=UPI0006F8A8DD|nr:helix-turn-helix transcriptional regulator [Cellulomonas sp. Leaf334]KQR17082.1 XRE family transcriptional regulator [Cellulomonas sp. Leaf334]
MTTGPGVLLRQWRERRRLSQLELSSQTGVSTRHLSYVETGRSSPSRDLVLRLSSHLDVPLRERNHLLVAAGFAPEYRGTPLDDPSMSAVRAALRVVLDGHGPNPALVVDRSWNLVEANAAVAVLLGDVDPVLLEPPVNVLRVAMHPRGMAPHIANLAEWRAHALDRVRRQVMATGDRGLAALLDELSAYPGGEMVADASDGVAIPMGLDVGGEQLTFLTTVATFGTPLDITVAELVIESFYPADARTAEALARLTATVDPALVEAVLSRTRGS